MMTRRTLLIGAAATAVLLSRHWPAQAAVNPQTASAFVNQTGQALVQVVNSGAPEAQRKAELATIVERSVDIDAVGRFCLGRFWRVATPAQQQEYLQQFRRVLITSITGHLGDYKGVTFVLGRTHPLDGNVAVESTVTRPGTAPSHVDWVVDASGRIVDVVAEGTSMRLTQRSDYASFLSRNGNNVQALIDALKRQAANAG